MNKIVIGNWKMNLTVRESVALARACVRAMRGKLVVPDVIICPSFTALADVSKILRNSRIYLGAQNMHSEPSGAFTGEVSGHQLADLSVKYAIIGHSERRALGETDELISEKVKSAFNQNIMPILCVGEEKINKAKAEQSVLAQLQSALSKTRERKGTKIIIAYEPAWAIGTGNSARVEDVAAMHKVLRDEAQQKGFKASVIYGGSVDSENTHEYLREQEIDGLLVGGASLSASQFEVILKIAEEVIAAQTNNI
ncbi:MAG: triosephosphate isomerase [uncultured bacterium]|nr:MAG: triosephosphate isomerase [uncultured bacterium]HBD04835.1 triose-phosphate isomerase [Candidatus Uhrbacteria bacterium]